jgi:hypothetical protein
VLGIAAIPLLLSLFTSSDEARLVWWTTHALEKIHPNDPAPRDPAHAVKISAGRNEFEPFQVVFRAEDRDIENMDVDVTDLRGSGNGLIAKTNITVYLERYLDLKMPSSIEGGTGEWPDPLVPRIDAYSHERRNAFPFKLTRGRNQPVWVDVYVPLKTPAGTYRGNVQVLSAGKVTLNIPIALDVWDFDLPSTSSLITTFAFSGTPAARHHLGRTVSDKDVAAITSVYEKAALWHRITLDGSSGLPPAVSEKNGSVTVNWDTYDRHFAPFLDGTVFSNTDPLPGARFTSVALHTPPSVSVPNGQIQFWKQAAAHFRQKGWFDRLFNYLWDEPAKTQFAPMLERGAMVRRADPAIKNLVTAPLHKDWSDVIDIWTPVINCFERKLDKDYCEMTVSRGEYGSELAHGKRLWWYQACSTHGCNIVGGEYFTGWPGLMIDDAGIRNRIMEWMTWKYGIEGELYFNTNEAYFKKKDPWADVHLFGGNGDGTLFYPGRPDAIGGTTNIPVESIRLKLIREGLEDYEYLVMLAKRKGNKAAEDVINSFIRNLYDFDHDPSKLYAARERIARALDGER